ncbi:MAG: sugar phosphate isomerase/epimerase family protein [Arthrobacter sp.]|uniref:sugar phosphate isomerase/epimerase family protein n=1 Tax=Arthrobacter TaxID=1663 RepID=UPI00265481C1|nr:sugar phosphate isomerase/epimerase [Micrococcaceae bacterium]MDN5823028.1 sugar phosphate isomerase/epimerase [Micrococcaceae bacterium]MDN5879326.1 sugar phosphate isomerase/epimerase [Micrococcaceae bacterium]MDN5885602.1 sugar phosphate isomerase/epimerase [Micrococcaceae bacterium]
MQLSFSTLGCPDADVDEVLALAGEHGATGVELRMHEGGIISASMDDAERGKVKTAFADAGITILAVGSYVKICAPGKDIDVFRELEAALRLAADIGAKAVRVFPGAGLDSTSEADREEAFELEENAVRRLTAAEGPAAMHGVQLLLETHDSHPRGVDAARILFPLGPQGAVRTIWDVLHPWKRGEEPEATVKALAGRIEYLQLKDARRGSTADAPILTLPGEGDIPLEKMLRLYREQAPTGVDPWVSLEWEKAWNPDLPELGEALAATRKILDSLSSS